MKANGKVVGKLLKDSAKGKDAEAHEAGVIVVKLDAVEGIHGRLELPIEKDKLPEYELGDVGTVSFEVKQTRLGLTAAR